jgi:hypothetical protein
MRHGSVIIKFIIIIGLVNVTLFIDDRASPIKELKMNVSGSGTISIVIFVLILY